MNGLNKRLNKQKTIFNAARLPPKDGDFEWDGIDEDDRPLSKDEMHSGIRLVGRSAREMTKDRITIYLSHEVNEYFRATGKGWQTRIDKALLEYVKAHLEK